MPLDAIKIDLACGPVHYKIGHLRVGYSSLVQFRRDQKSEYPDAHPRKIDDGAIDTIAPVPCKRFPPMVQNYSLAEQKEQPPPSIPPRKTLILNSQPIFFVWGLGSRAATAVAPLPLVG